jgi:hypothetical protein
MPWSDWLKLAGVGLLGNTCYQVLFAIGLDLTTSAISSLLIGTIPIWTALLAMALGWERISTRTWVGIALAFGGVVLVTLGSPQGNSSTQDLLVGEPADPWGGDLLGRVYCVFEEALREILRAARLRRGVGWWGFRGCGPSPRLSSARWIGAPCRPGCMEAFSIRAASPLPWRISSGRTAFNSLGPRAQRSLTTSCLW